jgi:hypothetical protein
MPVAWKAVLENNKIKLWQVYADWTEGRKIIDKDTRYQSRELNHEKDEK